MGLEGGVELSRAVVLDITGIEVILKAVQFDEVTKEQCVETEEQEAENRTLSDPSGADGAVRTEKC